MTTDPYEAPLDEDGFALAASWNNSTAMAIFLSRAADKEGVWDADAGMIDPASLKHFAYTQWGWSPRKGASLASVLHSLKENGIVALPTTTSTRSPTTSTTLSTTKSESSATGSNHSNSSNTGNSSGSESGSGHLGRSSTTTTKIPKSFSTSTTTTATTSAAGGAQVAGETSKEAPAGLLVPPVVLTLLSVFAGVSLMGCLVAIVLLKCGCCQRCRRSTPPPSSKQKEEHAAAAQALEEGTAKLRSPPNAEDDEANIPTNGRDESGGGGDEALAPMFNQSSLPRLGLTGRAAKHDNPAKNIKDREATEADSSDQPAEAADAQASTGLDSVKEMLIPEEWPGGDQPDESAASASVGWATLPPVATSTVGEGDGDSSATPARQHPDFSPNTVNTVGSANSHAAVNSQESFAPLAPSPDASLRAQQHQPPSRQVSGPESSSTSRGIDQVAGAPAEASPALSSLASDFSPPIIRSEAVHAALAAPTEELDVVSSECSSGVFTYASTGDLASEWESVGRANI
mmetsp:Transcript_97487/g.203461  ORF Transcript_97487/g.203461 Transcript_97487/m.203461 type:complete len:517 (+) Transcript_97487:2-1552(+)